MRYQQHEAAEELAATLLDFLLEGLTGQKTLPGT